MPDPAVTVLLTSYNRARFLPQAAGSVFAQTMGDWELIILDDNSADPAVVDYLKTVWHHPQVVVYKSRVAEEDRAGTCRFAVQYNTGLQLARGRHVTYLADDDWYAPNRLELMSAMLDEHPEYGVVYGNQGITDEAGRVDRLRPVADVLADAYCAVDLSSVMHTAQAGRDAGGWDTSAEHWSLGDAVFWRRLHAAGYSFHLAGGGEPLDFHRMHPNGCNLRGGPYDGW